MHKSLCTDKYFRYFWHVSLIWSVPSTDLQPSASRKQDRHLLMSAHALFLQNHILQPSSEPNCTDVLQCRENPGKNGLSRVDSMALKANAASIAKMHDSGRTVDPTRDISLQYRPHRGYSGSHHGGNLYAEVGGSLHSQNVGGSMHKKKSLPRNYSDGALVRAQTLGHSRQVCLVACDICVLLWLCTVFHAILLASSMLKTWTRR